MRIITIDELLSLLAKYNHRELHVHHTWKPEHKDFNGSNGLALQQAMRNYHVNTNGWDDIAQHVTLLPDGTFVTGRDFGKNPASIKDHNWGLPFCVEMIGNFDVGHDKLEGKQKESILRIAKYFDDRGKYIRFHRENSAKTCPGTGIDKSKFMAEVKEYGKSKDDFTGHWAEKEIRQVLASGKMSGFPDGTFRPNEPITRAQLAVLMAKGVI